MKKLEPQIVEKIVIQKEFILLGKQPHPHSGWLITLPSTTPSIEVAFSFIITQSPTGCGLGTFAGWSTSKVINFISPSDNRTILVNAIKREAQISNLYCLIATLGDTYIGKNGVKSNYENFIEELGFKERHSYANKNHGTGYQQKIYTCETSDLK